MRSRAASLSTSVLSRSSRKTTVSGPTVSPRDSTRERLARSRREGAEAEPTRERATHLRRALESDRAVAQCGGERETTREHAMQRAEVARHDEVVLHARIFVAYLRHLVAAHEPCARAALADEFEAHHEAALRQLVAMEMALDPQHEDLGIELLAFWVAPVVAHRPLAERHHRRLQVE